MKTLFKAAFFFAFFFLFSCQSRENFQNPNSNLSPLGSSGEEFKGTLVGTFENDQGRIENVSAETPNPNSFFFRSIGTNGRSCVTCHQPSEDFTISLSG